MFVRVIVCIEKKKLSFKHENTRFSRTQTYTVIEENSKKRATEYVIDDLCVCVCMWHSLNFNEAVSEINSGFADKLCIQKK